MLFQMLLVERSHELSGAELPRPRQVFVTQSPVLAKKVKDYFETLVDGLRTATLSVDQMRDKKQAETQVVLPMEGTTDLIHEEDRARWRKDLPDKLSDLSDEHFPLITTVDKVRVFVSDMHALTIQSQLWSMIEADIAVTEEADTSTAVSRASKWKMKDVNTPQQVTFDMFLKEYWPRFKQSFTKQFGRLTMVLSRRF